MRKTVVINLQELKKTFPLHYKTAKEHLNCGKIEYRSHRFYWTKPIICINGYAYTGEICLLLPVLNLATVLQSRGCPELQP